MPLWLEAFHLRIKHADAVHVALLRVTAQQLLTDADAQHGLSQVADQFVQSAGLQIRHRPAGLALSGEEHLVGLP